MKRIIIHIVLLLLVLPAIFLITSDPSGLDVIVITVLIAGQVLIQIFGFKAFENIK